MLTRAVTDKLWASYVGRPPTITSAHYETPLPRIFKEKDEVLWHSRIDPTDEEDIELPSFASTTFHWTARLAILAEKISNAVYALKVDVRAARTRAIASDLHLQLGQFYDSIPPAISISAHSNKPHPTHVILLHMWYW